MFFLFSFSNLFSNELTNDGDDSNTFGFSGIVGSFTHVTSAVGVLLKPAYLDGIDVFVIANYVFIISSQWLSVFEPRDCWGRGSGDMDF